jgi:hypothetical protein
MVLEVLIIGGVVYYFAHKRHEKKKARRAAEAAAAAAAGGPSNQQQISSSSRNKDNEAGGYSDLPSYGDARRQGPPVYDAGAVLPGYEERGALVNEKSPLVNVHEQSR